MSSSKQLKIPSAIIKEPVLLFDNKPSDPNSIELLTVTEVSKLLKVSVTAVRRLQQARSVPFFKIGGSVRFLKSDIISYLTKRRIESIG